MPRLSLGVSFFLVLCIRALIALSTSGFFQPDEYFQALEPAHQAVFGYGHLTWEWAANPPIRSFIYPSLFVPAYTLVKKLNLENAITLIWAPKLVQVVFAAFGDTALYSLASSLLSEEHGTVSLLLSLISPFNTLTLTRTLSNSTETSLTTMALAFWPFPGRSRSRTRVALSLAALSCIIRPTGAVLWTFLGLELAWRWKSSASRIVGLALDVSLVGAIAVALTVAIDSVYYGTLTLTPISFLRTNILSGIAHFYGVNTFHYYLTQGIPIVLGPSLPFALHGIWKHVSVSLQSTQDHPHRTPNPALSILLGLVAWTISTYSCLTHKEWRFIHPLLPVLHIFAADSLIHLKNNATKYVANSKTPSDFNKTQQRNLDTSPRQLRQLPVRLNHLVFLLGISLPLNTYLICFHGSAQVTVARYLHALGQDETRVRSVGVLMPCHSIPWQSHIHISYLAPTDGGSRLWALGCEPPLGLNSTQTKAYASQTDVFFERIGPISYFQTHFPQSVDPKFPPSPAPYTIPGRLAPEDGWKHTWPSHLLIFGALENQVSFDNATTVKTKLEELGYRVIRRISNGWEEDERRKGGIIVWEWNGNVV